MAALTYSQGLRKECTNTALHFCQFCFHPSQTEKRAWGCAFIPSLTISNKRQDAEPNSMPKSKKRKRRSDKTKVCKSSEAPEGYRNHSFKLKGTSWPQIIKLLCLNQYYWHDVERPTAGADLCSFSPVHHILMFPSYSQSQYCLLPMIPSLLISQYNVI